RPKVSASPASGWRGQQAFADIVPNGPLRDAHARGKIVRRVPGEVLIIGHGIILPLQWQIAMSHSVVFCWVVAVLDPVPVGSWQFRAGIAGRRLAAWVFAQPGGAEPLAGGVDGDPGLRLR